MTLLYAVYGTRTSNKKLHVLNLSFSSIAIGNNVACNAMLLFASNLNGSNPIAFHLLLF